MRNRSGLAGSGSRAEGPRKSLSGRWAADFMGFGALFIVPLVCWTIGN